MRRFACLCGFFAIAVCARASAALAQAYPVATDHHRRAVPGGRAVGCRRAHPAAANERGARAVGRHREQERRGRSDRHDLRRALAARRIYVADHRQCAGGDGAGVAEELSVRSAEGAGRRVAAHRDLSGAGGASGFADQVDGRRDPARQGKAGADFRQRRRRLRAPDRGRAAGCQGRHRDQPCAVSGWRVRPCRSSPAAIST